MRSSPISERTGIRTLPAIAAATISLFLGGCGAEPTPEDRVRDFIIQASESAEARKWRSFADYIADDYFDGRGLAKEEVLAVITRYILANRRIHILKRVASIRIEDPRHAHAVIYAAMAGQPVATAEDLARITADVYRFEFDLRAGTDGAFRVTGSNWRPVGPEQFLIGR